MVKKSDEKCEKDSTEPMATYKASSVLDGTQDLPSETNSPSQTNTPSQTIASSQTNGPNQTNTLISSIFFKYVVGFYTEEKPIEFQF
jgi:hypothetical protein